jgi:DNA-binding transcriptional LysR family regulator
MNIHHLELFYYVAKHGGIAAAVRKIPYGIQQPAVSGQIAMLEESLGVKLFNRRPFALSAEGLELFRFIESFFANVGSVAEKIRGNALPQLRIAAPALALHDYLPELLRRVRANFPEFRLNMHEANQADAERLLEAQEIDLAITLIEKKPRSGLHSQALMELPLLLLVPQRHPIIEAKELWEHDKIEETLITFPQNEPVCSLFQKGLSERGVEWFTGIEVNSVRLIERYVASGFGIGVTAAAPGVGSAPEIRCIPLDDFPRITVGAVWNGKLSAIAQQFLAEVESQAKGINV